MYSGTYDRALARRDPSPPLARRSSESILTNLTWYAAPSAISHGATALICTTLDDEGDGHIE